MLLPTKGLSPDRSLVFLGGQVLLRLGAPTTVSSLWTGVRSDRGREPGFAPLTYDWFLLSLDLLYVVGAVQLDEYGRIARVGVQ
jgi:hypothetical protein